jgi:arylsulfatase A-like enzyme
MIEDLSVAPDEFSPEPYVDELATYATTEDGTKSALRTSDWKYINGPSTTKLYSLANDPAEQNDLSDQYPELINLFDQIERSKRSQTTEKASIAAGAMEIDGAEI